MRKSKQIKDLREKYHHYKHLAEFFEKKLHKANHDKKYETTFEPGHFYSPYPDLKDISRRKNKIFDRSKRDLPGIDINEKFQLEMIRKLAKHYKKMPYSGRKNSKLRYYFGQHAYSYGDATMLFCMLLEYKPKKVIEIGSGFSSALMLDANENFLDNQTKLTFIEPYPELLLKMAKKTDKNSFHLISKKLHQVDNSLFDELDAGDILFIDSTHVSKVGSDVNQLIFEVLPRLKKGVIIHIHDVFYPFEYPYERIKEQRAWNEDYMLRAFLYKNPEFRILVFNDFLYAHHKNHMKKHMPVTLKNSGGSLWLEKIQ